MIELFAQLSFVDHLGKTDVFGTVDQRKGHLRIRTVPKHGLTHQQLVEIRVDQRPHDRVDFPFVVIDAGGDVDHLRRSFSCNELVKAAKRRVWQAVGIFFRQQGQGGATALRAKVARSEERDPRSFHPIGCGG